MAHAISRRRFVARTSAAVGAVIVAKAPAALGQQVRELNVWHTEVEPPTVKTIQETSIAEFERSLIRKRCEEGIQRAKGKGTKFGRPSTLDVGQRRRIAERFAAGESMAELARDYECGETTIWRALQ